MYTHTPSTRSGGQDTQSKPQDMAHSRKADPVSGAVASDKMTCFTEEKTNIADKTGQTCRSGQNDIEADEQTCENGQNNMVKRKRIKFDDDGEVCESVEESVDARNTEASE